MRPCVKTIPVIDPSVRCIALNRGSPSENRHLNGIAYSSFLFCSVFKIYGTMIGLKGDMYCTFLYLRLINRNMQASHGVMNHCPVQLIVTAVQATRWLAGPIALVSDSTKIIVAYQGYEPTTRQGFKPMNKRSITRSRPALISIFSEPMKKGDSV